MEGAGLAARRPGQPPTNLGRTLTLGAWVGVPLVSVCARGGSPGPRCGIGHLLVGAVEFAGPRPRGWELRSGGPRAVSPRGDVTAPALPGACARRAERGGRRWNTLAAPAARGHGRSAERRRRRRRRGAGTAPASARGARGP